jgi:hypoxanthine phosphoribosyltransferase
MIADFKDVEDLYARAKPLITPVELDRAFDAMAAEITRELKGEYPIVLAVMNGALFCTSEIIKRLDFPLQLDYIHVTRYQGEIRGGDLNWKAEPSISLEGRTVLVIDDILDLGLTLGSIIDFCANVKLAKKVYSAAMLDKKVERAEGGLLKADFTGLEVGNHFLIGAGLDYKGFFRNLMGVYRIET